MELNMKSTTELHPPSGACPHCSSYGQWIYHGGTCPRIKSIEYQPDGRTPKKVEFHPPRGAQVIENRASAIGPAKVEVA